MIRGASPATLAALASLLGAVVACGSCRTSGASGDPAARAGTGGADAPEVAPYDLAFTEVDAAVAEGLERDLDEGIRAVEAFFGRPFAAPFAVEVFPDRAAFTRSFPPEWGMPETDCWMVAAGVADALRILSPHVWTTDACEHDPRDAEHVRGIVVHELTHVFHGQHNPTGDFTGAEEVGWFAEGLAVVVSGQLETGHRASARQAVRQGAVPRELERAWSGPHRYGVCGTLVLYLDELLGRERLFELLAATTEGEILEAAGLSEEELLAEWQAFVEVDAGR